jgi:hypothetical protein
MDGHCSRWTESILGELEFRKAPPFTISDDPHLHYFNRHFGVVLRPACSTHPHDSYVPALHHLCLRVESADDVAAAASRLRAAGIAVSTLLTHQHHVVDVLTGWLLASLAMKLIYPRVASTGSKPR